MVDKIDLPGLTDCDVSCYTEYAWERWKDKDVNAIDMRGYVYNYNNRGGNIDVEKDDEILERLNQIRKIFPVPANNFSWNKNGNILKIEYEKKNDNIFAKIQLKCSCSGLIIDYISLEVLKENLETDFSDFIYICNKCQKEFHIPAHLERFRYIE